MTDEITRREALRRAAWMLGGTLSAPTILGVLAGCGDRGPAPASWTPRTLTTPQQGMVVAIADAIIPETDTPGARAAHIDQFVDAMLTVHYPAADRDRFIAGLARVDARAQRMHGRAFGELTGAQQAALVAELDQLAFREVEATVAGETEVSPRVPQADVATGRGTGPNPAAAAIPPTPDPADVGPQSFFRMMKELAVVGYYTSEVGATRELRVNPMVPYRDIAYTPGTPGWA